MPAAPGITLRTRASDCRQSSPIAGGKRPARSSRVGSVATEGSGGSQLGEGVPGRLLLGRLFGAAVALSEGLAAGVDDGKVFAPVAGALAGDDVVVGRRPVSLLDHL